MHWYFLKSKISSIYIFGCLNFLKILTLSVLPKVITQVNGNGILSTKPHRSHITAWELRQKYHTPNKLVLDKCWHRGIWVQRDLYSSQCLLKSSLEKFGKQLVFKINVITTGVYTTYALYFFRTIKPPKKMQITYVLGSNEVFHLQHLF